MSLPSKRARLVKSCSDVAKELILFHCSCCGGDCTYCLLLIPAKNGVGRFQRKGVIVDSRSVENVTFRECPKGAQHSNVSGKET
jgi:hypothetical protein